MSLMTHYLHFTYKVYIFARKLNSDIMNTKLTLNLNKSIIDEAKSYAKKNHVSLSKLIENYLNSLTSTSKKSTTKISPLVESLTGIISSEVNDKKSYRDYLSEKYS